MASPKHNVRLCLIDANTPTSRFYVNTQAQPPVTSWVHPSGHPPPINSPPPTHYSPPAGGPPPINHNNQSPYGYGNPQGEFSGYGGPGGGYGGPSGGYGGYAQGQGGYGGAPPPQQGYGYQQSPPLAQQGQSGGRGEFTSFWYINANA
jgi:hypothetical protein